MKPFFFSNHLLLGLLGKHWYKELNFPKRKSIIIENSDSDNWTKMKAGYKSSHR